MPTTNPAIVGSGTVVATGPVNVTVTPTSGIGWAIGTSLGEVSGLGARHRMEASVDRSMTLATGEVLVLFGGTPPAVTVSAV